MTHKLSVACFGEMLWDMLPEGKQPGGAPMNVAYHFHNLGVDAAFISRVGKDELGKELLDFLKQKDVPLHHVQIDSNVQTGIVNVELNNKGEASYEIVAPAAWDHIALTNEAKNVVKQSAAFTYVSLVARHEDSYQSLLQLLQEASFKVFDVNLRPPFYSQELIEALAQPANMLKINHHELEEVCGWYSDASNEIEQIRFLKNKFNLDAVLVTRGENGASFIGPDDQYIEHPGFTVKVADTVGSGDSFLAGFVSKWLQGLSPKECLEFACGVGATVASKHGACNPISPEEIAATMAS